MHGSPAMNSWTDIALITAIVIGLISAASLPMVSVHAVSPESLRMTQARHDDPSPWALVSEGRLDTLPSMRAESTAAADTARALDADLGRTTAAAH